MPLSPYARRRAAKPAPALPAPIAGQSGWKLTFADEFETFSWNSNYSSRVQGARTPNGTWSTIFGYDVRWLAGNDEKSCALDPTASQNPFSVSPDNYLRMKAQPSTNLAETQNQPYTGALITTDGVLNQQYGYWEVRARFSKGQGVWPAIWLLTRNDLGSGQTYQWPPEIDIMEGHGHRPYSTHWATHTATGTEAGDWVPVDTDTCSEFVRHAVNWQSDFITWYVDDRQIAQVPTPTDCKVPMYLLVYLAIGGSWPGYPDATTVFPAYLDVDYVRVWSKAAGAVAVPNKQRRRPVFPATRAKAAATGAPPAPSGAPTNVLPENQNTGATAGNDKFQSNTPGDIFGGAGDNTYVVTGERVYPRKNAGEAGVDTVEAWVHLALKPNIAHLKGNPSYGLSLVGNAQANRITGGLNQNDTISGGGGDDEITLNGGSNVLVVTAGESDNITVTGFKPGAAAPFDRVLLVGYGVPTPGHALRRLAVSVSGSDTVLTLDNTERVTFLGVLPSAFVLANFAVAAVSGGGVQTAWSDAFFAEDYFAEDYFLADEPPGAPGTPATVASFAVDGAGGGADAVLPFAYAFPKGAVPAGADVVLRRADDQTKLRTQVDVKNTWPDGSARHALLAAELPALTDGQALQVEVRANEAHPSPGAALDLATALSGRTVRIEISPQSQDNTGTAFGYDLHASGNIPSGGRFRSGPLATEARYVVDVPGSAMSNADLVTGSFTKGAAGGTDTLPHSKVLFVFDVAAGGSDPSVYKPYFNAGTRYDRGASWYRAGGSYGWDGNQISWAPAGAEPAPGTSVQALYAIGTTASAAIGVRLIADLMVCKDGSLWVDVAVANDACDMAGSTSANRRAVGFGLKVLVDGVAVIDAPGVYLAPYQWFNRCAGKRGAKVMKSGVAGHGWGVGIAGWIKPDVDTLADAEASMRFEKGIAPHANRVAAWTGSAAGSMASMGRPDWDEPMGMRGWSSWTGSFLATGGRWDLGHACEPNALMVARGERWMHKASHDIHEATMGVQWHCWDRTGGPSGTGGWLDPVRRPTAASISNDANVVPVTPVHTPFQIEVGGSHVGSTHAMVYLVSGRRTALDGVHAQAAHHVHCMPMGNYRGPISGTSFDTATGEGVNFHRRNQIRGGCWGFRAFVEADYFSASDHNPNGDYWKRVIEGNLKWLVDVDKPKYAARHGAVAGFRYDEERYGALQPWEFDFGAPWYLRAVRLGYANADAWAQWCKTFYVGRFAQDQAVMPVRYGAIYNVFAEDCGVGAYGLPDPLYPLHSGYRTSWTMYGEMWTRLADNPSEYNWDEANPPGLNGRYYGRVAYSAVAAYADTYPDDAAVQLAMGRLWDANAVDATSSGGTPIKRIAYMDMSTLAISGIDGDACQFWTAPKNWTRPAGT